MFQPDRKTTHSQHTLGQPSVELESFILTTVRSKPSEGIISCITTNLTTFQKCLLFFGFSCTFCALDRQGPQ